MLVAERQDGSAIADPDIEPTGVIDRVAWQNIQRNNLMQPVIPSGTRIHVIDHPDITGTTKFLKRKNVYAVELDDIGEIDLLESNLVRIEEPPRKRELS